jgi:hypothetical protein
VHSRQQLQHQPVGGLGGSRRISSSGLTVRCQGSNGASASATDGNGSGSSGAAYALSTSNGTGAKRSRPNSEKPTGVGSDTGSGWKAPVLGSSQYNGLKTLFRYTCFTTFAGFLAWQAHPYLLDAIGYVLDLNWKETSVTPFQNSFFSVLSLLFAIFSGNSMGFLYDRQRLMVQQFYTEVGALEEVLEEAAYALGDEAYSVLNQVSKYIDQEIRGPSNQLPPLEDGLALNIIRSECRRYKDMGAGVDEVMAATSRLAEAQSMRQATSLQALPFVHWALLYIIANTFVLTLLLLEAGGNFSDEGRHVLFSATSSLMTFVLMVISDLSDPSEGVYAATAAMEERLGYTQRMLARHQKTTIIPEAGIGNQNRSNNAYFNRRPAGPESDDVAARNGSNRHNGNGAVALPLRATRKPVRRKPPPRVPRNLL